MNNGKTDVAVFFSRYRPKPSLHSVSVCDKTVECSPIVKNIGVSFDDSRSSNVTATCKSALYHLRNIYKTKKFHTPGTILYYYYYYHFYYYYYYYYYYPARAFGAGWGWVEMPAANNSKTLHGIEMKFGRVVENHN